MFTGISIAILATLCLLFFLVPGFAFLRRFWGSKKGDLQDSGINIYLLWGTPISISIYFVSYWIFTFVYTKTKLSIFRIDIQCLYDSLIYSLPVEKEQVASVIILCLFSTILAGRSAFHIQKVIISKGLDSKHSSLRFNNEWFYLLKGHDFYKDKLGLFKRNGRIITRANILCIVDNCPVIYSGYVSNFSFNKDGSIEFIQLIGTVREVMDPTGTIPPSVFAIDGDGLVIKGPEIKNINCEYSYVPSLPKNRFKKIRKVLYSIKQKMISIFRSRVKVI